MTLNYWERKRAYDPPIDLALHLRLDHGMSWAAIYKRINSGLRGGWYGSMGFMRKLVDYRIAELEGDTT